MNSYILRLYVTGNTPRAERAIQNLQRICAIELGGMYEMVVIDVLERPQLAEDEKILATPTLDQAAPAAAASHHRRPLGRREGLAGARRAAPAPYAPRS